MEKELNNLIEELTEDQDLYINLYDLVERFVNIDAQYNHTSWNLMQILSQLQMLAPRRMGNNTVKELLADGKSGCDLTKFYKSRGYQLPEFARP